MPVEPQGAREAQCGERLAGGGEAVVEGGAQVVLVGAEAGDDLALARPEPGAFAGGGPVLHPVPLPAPGGGLLAGQAPQPVETVVAQGVQEPEPHPVRPLFPTEHGLVDEPGDGVQHLVRPHPLPVRAHRLGRRRVEAAGQDRGPRPHQLLVFGAEFMAPVDGRAQCPVAGQGGGGAGGEEAVAVVEAFHEFVDAEDAHPDGGQFDGERQSVEAAAEPGDRGPVVGGEPEARDDGGGPVGEEGEGRVVLGAGERLSGGPRTGRQVVVRVGDGQRPYVHQVFLGQTEPVTAGGEDADAGGAAQQGGDEVGAGLQQVLAVVEDEQEAPVAGLFDQGGQRGPAGVVVQAEGVGGGDRDERRVVQPGQLHQSHPVGEASFDPGRDPCGHPCLADAARTGQRDQPRPREQFAALGLFAAPIDETGRLDRQSTVPSRR